jgi:hypothetical protein
MSSQSDNKSNSTFIEDEDNFYSKGKEHKPMLGHCKLILEHEPRKIAINQKFDKLIIALRTAVNNDGVLDKEVTSHNDIFDAFRLALKFYSFHER